MRIHSRKRSRYRCLTCGKTFSARSGTAFEGLRTEKKTVTLVIALLAYGCPLQAIVFAFGLDERTVAAWQQRAGRHCKQIQTAIIEQGKIDSQHIQADEIRAKGKNMVVWIALAMDISTRLWLAGTLSMQRDRLLIDRLFQRVRACCQRVEGLLVCTDGFVAYPNSIVRAFRDKVKKQPGRGRCALEVWPDLCVATIVKHAKKKRVVDITRHLSRGTDEKAKELLDLTKGGETFNTAFIERLNGTFRERLASLTRTCRHAAARMETLETGMYLIGCTYNFCFPHQELSKKKHFGSLVTPAMAAGCTDHIWDLPELLRYKVVPPCWNETAPVQSKRPRGRRRKVVSTEEPQPKRPRGRPAKYLLSEVVAAARKRSTFTT